MPTPNFVRVNHDNHCDTHRGGLLQREWSHVKSHWLSCVGFCLFTHAVFHLGEWLLEAVCG